jgi:hypothetical protein
MNYDQEKLANWIIDVLCGVEDMKEPYLDTRISEKKWIREFDPSISESEEYVWHRDLNDREITVIEGDGWSFQFDDELPQVINREDKIFVPKMAYHRLLVGRTKLKIHIEEFE